MQTNTNIPSNCWQEPLKALPWNPKHAAASAVKALSQLNWRGVPKYEAIDFILSLPAASHLRENPCLLYATWDLVSRQMTGEFVLPLELEPIFDTAA
ncbi:MAG: hypothetical protein ABSA47_19455 [Verrucomicrobiota bacterium]|jgi:hypothetical protein